MMNKTRKYIELFAGCGGLSIGLEAAGYELIFANEVSPMAGETFAFNIFHEDLESKSKKNELSKKVLWLASQYDRSNLKDRLRENPHEAKNGEYKDIDKESNDFINNKLIIGDVNKLIDELDSHSTAIDHLVNSNIDLVSGGPPCQSFSLAGLRDKNNYRNSLPWSFAKFVSSVKPKVVLLENVEGITAPFKEGDKYYFAWLEIAKTFALESYFPVCMLVNSKYFEIPQSRPRFILMAFREDIFRLLYNRHKRGHTFEILKMSKQFTSLCLENRDSIENISIKDYKLFEIDKTEDRKYFNGELLPKYVNRPFTSVHKAIDDIKSVKEEFNLSELNKGYVKKLNFILNIHGVDYLESHFLKNHEPRKHNSVVQSRFRLYQVLSKFENGQKKKIIDAIKGISVDTDSILNILKNHKVFMNGKRVYLKNAEEVLKYFSIIKTKKQTQRALVANLPSPAQLTIPDDVCHYDKNQLRTITVREMARIQTFPDWFEFKSKVTTGGKMRKFEVPQYTQVGNAVPPLLAYNFGNLINKIISKLDGTV